MAVRNIQSCPAAFLRWMEEVRDDNGCGLTKRALIAIIEAPDPVALSAETWNSVVRGETQAQLDVLFWAPSAGANAPPPSGSCSANATVPCAHALESAAIDSMRPTPSERPAPK
jgi:hypothetical protein